MTVRVAVVSEGPSELAIIEAIAQRLDPDVLVDHIWPDMTVSGRSYGWRGVWSWCAEHGPKLEVFMRGVIGREYDVLVVHVDCSMAHNLDITNPCPPAATTGSQLGLALLGQLTRGPTCWIVTMTPSLTSEAWIAASLVPPYTSKIPIECDPNVENELANRKLLRRKKGIVKKPVAQYRDLVAMMMTRWNLVTQVCGQAATFEQALVAAFACVAQGNGPTITSDRSS